MRDQVSPPAPGALREGDLAEAKDAGGYRVDDIGSPVSGGRQQLGVLLPLAGRRLRVESGEAATAGRVAVLRPTVSGTHTHRPLNIVVNRQMGVLPPPIE